MQDVVEFTDTVNKKLNGLREKTDKSTVEGLIRLHAIVECQKVLWETLQEVMEEARIEALGKKV